MKIPMTAIALAVALSTPVRAADGFTSDTAATRPTATQPTQPMGGGVDTSFAHHPPQLPQTLAEWNEQAGATEDGYLKMDALSFEKQAEQLAADHNKIAVRSAVGPCKSGHAGYTNHLACIFVQNGVGPVAIYDPKMRCMEQYTCVDNPPKWLAFRKGKDYFFATVRGYVESCGYKTYEIQWSRLGSPIGRIQTGEVHYPCLILESFEE